MLPSALRSRLHDVLGSLPVSATPLSGGCIADVMRIALSDGRSFVLKRDRGDGLGLDIEARMLSDLASSGVLPTPKVIHAEASLLVLEEIEQDHQRSPEGEAGFAEALAGLHAVTSETFGYDYDTLIGPLDQPNRRNEAWPTFFAESRIMAMTRVAVDRRGISTSDGQRLEKLCKRVEELIGEGPSCPSLIHGDLWSGNVLWNQGGVAAVIDPAIYFADSEMELAFMALFGNLSEAFWTRYADTAGIRPGFWESRKDLYNIYPLLVHAALFGGCYGRDALRIVASLGF